MVILSTIALGLILGSFANVLVDRLPRGATIRGRSRCERCRRTLSWWEIIPVVSALVLRHRCRTCRARIPLRLTLVELGSAALLLLVLWRHGGDVTWGAITDALGLWTLALLAIIDARDGVVPDHISIPAIVLLVILRLTANAVIASEPTASAAISMFVKDGALMLLSVTIGAGFFAAQRLLSRGRWVGDGDIRVGAIMGAMLALPQLLVALAASYIVGGAVASVLLVTHRAQRGAHLPLVPYLFAGSLITVLWGERIIGWYGLS